MANPSISFTDRYSSTLQPLLLLATDYLAIIIAEWCAVGGRDIVLELLGRKNDWFELNNFYFYLFVPLIFMVFLHWGRTYIRLLSIGEMIRRTFYSVIYAIVVSIVVLFIAGKAPVVLDICKIPGVHVDDLRHCFARQTLCFPRSFHVRAESFKTGAIFNIRHITSPIYIV